jgi:hypothetical protein
MFLQFRSALGWLPRFDMCARSVQLAVLVPNLYRLSHAIASNRTPLTSHRRLANVVEHFKILQSITNVVPLTPVSYTLHAHAAGSQGTSQAYLAYLT